MRALFHKEASKWTGFMWTVSHFEFSLIDSIIVVIQNIYLRSIKTYFWYIQMHLGAFYQDFQYQVFWK